jgi:hypothetical protein
MATKIITKNSSTTTAIPTAGDLVQGELAVNVTDKRLFTEDSGGAIVELGTNPSTLTSGAATFSGNLLVGKTTTAFGTAGIALRGTVADFTRDGGTPINVNRLTSDGSLIDFHKAGTVVGSIGTGYGVVDIKGGTSGLLMGNSAVLPVNGSGTLTTDSYDIGAGSFRFKDLYLSGTVNAGAATFSGAVTIGSATGQNAVFGTIIGSGGANEGAVIVSSATGTGWLGFNDGNNASIPGQVTYNHATNVLSLYSSGTVSVTGAATFSGTVTGTQFSSTSSSAALPSFGVTAGNGMYNPATNSIGWSTNSVERMRIDSSGNLTVFNGDIYAAKSNGNNILYLATDTTTNAAGMNCTSLGQSWVAGNNFGATDGRFSIYNLTANAERFSIAKAGGGIVTITDSTGFSIDARQSGTNGYGILSRFGGGGSGYMYSAYLDSPGAFKFYVTTDGAVYGNGTYGTVSDIKLKENIAAANSQWDDIKAVQLKNYSLIADNLDHADQLGVIAQDLEASGMGKLIDTLEDIDGDGESLGTVTKHVKYSILHLKALGALQEAMAKIEDLTARIEALEGA